MSSSPQRIRRFARIIETPDEYTYDVIYIDRTTGQRVTSYDGAEPTSMTDREMLQRLGYDIDEEIDITTSVVKVDPEESKQLIAEKDAQKKKEDEEVESRDLLNFLGDEVDTFDFSRWREGELTILKPALEKRGFTSVSFYMIEKDSFGPLIRGVTAINPEGQRMRFYYG